MSSSDPNPVEEARKEADWAKEFSQFQAERRATILNVDHAGRVRARGGFGAALQKKLDESTEWIKSTRERGKFAADQEVYNRISDIGWDLRKRRDKLIFYCDLILEVTPTLDQNPEDASWKYLYDKQIQTVQQDLEILVQGLESDDDETDMNSTIVKGPPNQTAPMTEAAAAAAADGTPTPAMIPPTVTVSAANTGPSVRPKDPMLRAALGGPPASLAPFRGSGRMNFGGGGGGGGPTVTLPSSVPPATMTGSQESNTFFTSTQRVPFIPPFPNLGDVQNQTLNLSLAPNPAHSNPSIPLARNMWPKFTTRTTANAGTTAAGEPTVLNYLGASAGDRMLGGLFREQPKTNERFAGEDLGLPGELRGPHSEGVGEMRRVRGAAGERAGAQVQGASREGEAGAISSLLSIYSQSLASQFSSSNIITRKFTGEIDYFDTWFALWMKCHNIMIRSNFEKSTMFLELLSTLGGTAKNLISGLSVTSEQSYEIGLRAIYAAYSQRTQSLRSHIFKFVTMPQCNAQTDSRLRMHSNLIQYVTSLESIGASAEETLIGWELSCLLEKLDFELHRKFCRYLEKQRDPRTPLGYSVDINSMISELHRMIIEETKFNTLNWQATPTLPGGGKRQEKESFKQMRYGAAAAAALPSSDAALPSSAKQTEGGRGRERQKCASAANRTDSASTVGRRSRSLSPGLASQASASANASNAYGFNREREQSRERSASREPQTRSYAAVANRQFNRDGGGRQWQRSNSTSPGRRQYQGNRFHCPICINRYMHLYPRSCPDLVSNKFTEEELRNLIRSGNYCINCFLRHEGSRACNAPRDVACSHENCTMRHHRIFHGHDNSRNAASSHQQNRPSQYRPFTAAGVTFTNRP